MKTYKLAKTISGVVKSTVEIQTTDLLKAMENLALDGIDSIIVSNKQLTYSIDRIRCELELSTSSEEEICTILAKAI